MRRQDWVARLWETVREYQHAPFGYGKADCCTFVARCVDAMTGSVLTAELDYGDRRGAARLLLKHDGIVGAVSHWLGSPTPGRAARRGDVCQVGPRMVGICVGSDVMVRTSDGIATRPLARVIRHWRVD